MALFKSANSTIPKHVEADRIYPFNIFADPEKNGDDVHQAHRMLHDKAPDIFYTPHNGGHWMATRFADARYIMTHPELFSSKEAYFSPDVAILKITLPPQDMDSPEHGYYRPLLMKFLGPKHIAPLESQIRQLSTELIDNVLEQGHCEFVADISVPLPVKTFMRMMGMDLSKYTKFVKWANGILASKTLLKRAPYFFRMSIYLKSLIRQRKKNLGSDPISMFLTSEINGEPLTDQRVFEICNLLFLAGLDTVTNAMSFIAKHLAENPEEQQRLRENPEQIGEAIEEFMRRYAFVSIPRRVAKNTEINGVMLKKGDIIICSLTAANNDAQRIEGSLEADLDRKKLPHLAFNTGPHNCAGIALARMELRVFLEEWLRRVPPFTIAPDYQPVARGGAIMALETLELRW